MVRTGILILLNTLQSVPPLKNHRTGLLSLGVHGESREKNARRTDNAADEYLCQSQAFTELFFRYFYELVQQLGFILVSKKCFKTMNLLQIDVQISKIFPPAAGHSFLLSLFILVLDIRFFLLSLFILVLDIRRTYQMPVKVFARIRYNIFQLRAA